MTKKNDTSKEAAAAMIRGCALYDDGKHKEAITQFEQATKINPKNTEAFTLWGCALNELGEYAEAIKQFKQVLKINPDDHDILQEIELCQGKLNEV